MEFCHMMRFHGYSCRPQTQCLPTLVPISTRQPSVLRGYKTTRYQLSIKRYAYTLPKAFAVRNYCMLNLLVGPWEKGCTALAFPLPVCYHGEVWANIT